MVKISNSDTAVISHLRESAIELDSSQQVAMTYIDCVIKEDEITGCEISCPYPSQRAVGV